MRSFPERFWNDERGHLADVVDVDHVSGTRDDTCRPNQILAVGGLPIALLADERARRVVECVEQRLLTPLGLRSLAPDESGYAPRYEGDSSTRDAVYHQGTVWPWLMGSFVDAWLRVRGNTEAARVEARTQVSRAADAASRRSGPRPRVRDCRCRAAVHAARLSVSGVVARRAPSGAARPSCRAGAREGAPPPGDGCIVTPLVSSLPITRRSRVAPDTPAAVASQRPWLRVAGI